MDHIALNTAPLKKFGKYFKLFLWVRRARMILFRVALLAAIIFVFYFVQQTLTQQTDVEYSYSGSLPLLLNPFFYISIWVVAMVIRFTVLTTFWAEFKHKNKLGNTGAVTNTSSLFTKVPSFKKKYAATYSPAVGSFSRGKYAIFPRSYKEGGLLRWRERRMDSIMCFRIADTKFLPHIIINSTLNEKTRRTNLKTDFNRDWEISFEGAHGEHYDVYVSPKNRIKALQIFTPDLLEILYKNLPSADIEIKGRSIWIIQRDEVLSDVVADKMIAATNVFMPAFINQLETARVIKKAKAS